MSLWKRFSKSSRTAPVAEPVVEEASGLANTALATAQPEALQRELGLRLHRLAQAYLADRSRLTDLGATWPSQLSGLIQLYDQAIVADARPAWFLERGKLLLQAGRLDEAWSDLQLVEQNVEAAHKKPIWKALIELAKQRHDDVSLAHYQQLLSQL